MRILFVYQFCTLGGVEAVLKNRLPEFYRQGVDSEVLFLSDQGGSKAFKNFKKIHFENRGKELIRIIDEGRFDFIIPIDTPQIYPILKRSRFDGLQVTEVHTTNLDILKYLSAIGETNTKAIITPSRFEKELVFKEIKEFEKTGIPVYVVPNPINLELFQFKEPRSKPDKKVIGWVGRLEKGKNWKHFLEMASEMAKERNDLLFLVIGGRFAESNVKKDFLETVKRLGLIDCLKWVSFLDHDRMPAIYSLMGASGGCLVATSLSESFGITAIEAMACRCPVVASRVGGFQEVITDGENGLLFELNNTQEALTQMRTLIDDSSERTRIVKNAWVAVKENYSPERVVDRYLAVLRELIKKVPTDSQLEMKKATPLSHSVREKSF